MINVTIATNLGQRVVKARLINARWCAHRDYTFNCWTLTHRLTGYSAGRVRTFKKAIALALALEKKFPPKRWVFTDPTVASTFKGARALVAKHEAAE